MNRRFGLRNWASVFTQTLDVELERLAHGYRHLLHAVPVTVGHARQTSWPRQLIANEHAKPHAASGRVERVVAALHQGEHGSANDGGPRLTRP